jgi:hypothetical protein
LTKILVVDASGVDWYVSREDLGADGQDADRINCLSRMMRHEHAKTPSIQYREPWEEPYDLTPDLNRTLPQHLIPTHLHTLLPGREHRETPDRGR